MSVNKIKQPVKKGLAKVPTVIQMEAVECGAASLTMILAYFGKWIPLEQVRRDCGVSRDGSNAKNLLTAARSYGLNANGYRMEPDALRQHGTFPCIIHWNFNHYVVVRGFKGRKVYLNDPAGGAYSVSWEQFDKSFTGICLMFSPTDAFVADGAPKSVLNFARNRMKGLVPALVFTAIATAIISVAGAVTPVFNSVFIDRILTNRNPEWAAPFLIALAALFALEALANTLYQVTLFRINGKLSVSGNLTFMWKILHLPMNFFSQRLSGDVLSRQTANVYVANVLVNTLAPLALDTVMLVFYLVVMLRNSLLLSVLGVLSIVLNMGVSVIVSRKRLDLSRVSARDAGQLASDTVSGVRMMETIKSSGAEEGYFARWAGHQAAYGRTLADSNRLDSGLGLVPAAVTQVTGMVILGLGVLLAVKGSYTLGSISAFQGLFTAFSAPSNKLINAGQTLGEMRTQMERIDDVMKYPEDEPFERESDDDTKSLEKLRGAIEINHLTFGYAPLGEPLIRDFNMKIEPGKRVAFVGASGCGKSTLSKLISGLYNPRSGEILYDGQKLENIDRKVFKASVAVVDQDIVLFEDTVANNIKMWDRTIEDYEMILAARDAAIHDDIMATPEGYGMKLLEGGKNLSGGQRQRLEIARVLAQDPTVIILDEATSALDAQTEFNVVNAIRDRGITCIVVAHRLSTIRDCDEIVVLDHGVVKERGTHEELMRQSGLYAALVTNE